MVLKYKPILSLQGIIINKLRRTSYVHVETDTIRSTPTSDIKQALKRPILLIYNK